MSDEQKNIDDGKRWQVDYDCNLVWEQTSKSNTNLNELKKLFGYAERFYDILPSSFEKSDGPYYKIILKPKDNWSSIPDMDDNLKRNFYEDTQEINVAFLTISNDTRENNKKGKEKIISSNLKNHINSIKLRCQGNLYYDQSSEYKEVVFEADKLGIYIANREVLHEMRGNVGNVPDIDLVQNGEQKTCLHFLYNRIIFGAPGTGKSHKLEVDSRLFETNFERVTFHPNYSYAQFVGTYKPVQDENSADIVYEYVPGPFMRIYVKALNNPNDNFLLLIEEINRANVASVFGDVFQLLDRKNGISEYPVATTEDIKKYLIKELKCFKKKDSIGNESIKSFDEFSDDDIKKCMYMCVPSNMYIWATMNSADQGVFPMDTAFKRRWEFEYLSVNDDEQVAAIKDYVIPMCFKNKDK